MQIQTVFHICYNFVLIQWSIAVNASRDLCTQCANNKFLAPTYNRCITSIAASL